MLCSALDRELKVNYLELFMKSADTLLIILKWGQSPFSLSRHLLPVRRDDLTAFSLLQPNRGGRPQIHVLRLVSTATSTRE